MKYTPSRAFSFLLGIVLYSYARSIKHSKEIAVRFSYRWAKFKVERCLALRSPSPIFFPILCAGIITTCADTCSPYSPSVVCYYRDGFWLAISSQGWVRHPFSYNWRILYRQDPQMQRKFNFIISRIVSEACSKPHRGYAMPLLEYR